MGNPQQSPNTVISLPQGGGAIRGLGESFHPEPQTGTGNLTIPLDVPLGRGGFQPTIAVSYSTGAGNGLFGLGWGAGLPSISRRTAQGVPRYRADDVFLLTGDELVEAEPVPGGTRYRPRIESAFAQILRLSDGWLVTGTDGVGTRFGTPRPDGAPADWRDPAVVADPADPSRVFAWLPTKTQDPLGNVIRYEYAADAGDTDIHCWHQPIPLTIRYADYDAGGPNPAFLYTVGFEYEPRPDPFSSYVAGFEVRTTLRCRAVTTTAWPGGVEQPVRRYELLYRQDSHTQASLLAEIQTVGYATEDDGATWTPQRDLPPVRFEYGAFLPEERRFLPVRCSEPPPVALSDGEYDFADVTGDGRPDVVRLGIAPTYWRNLGGGVLDRPRPLPAALDGISLNDRGVRLLDADGDGRADLMIDNPVPGFLPLRSASQWGDFHPYRSVPAGMAPGPPSTFGTGAVSRGSGGTAAGTPWHDARLQLVDLDGDGVTDAVLTGDRLICWFQRRGTGWIGPTLARGAPPVYPGDPRVHWADLSGDGLQDLVLVESGAVQYWPNLGHGRFGTPIVMTGGPDLPVSLQPSRVLFGDVSGDGTADLLYAGAGEVTVWFNRSGNSWSAPLIVGGLPDDWWDVRLCDLLGTGTSGVLFSRDATDSGRASLYFLDLTGGLKPRLLTTIDNRLGAVTRVAYAPSTVAEHDDRTSLPFVVPVVTEVTTADLISGGTLTTRYRYRHGHWDGYEREFRGFACVEQEDTETFDEQHGGLDRTAFAPPVLTRTWYHLGPVAVTGGPDGGGWTALELAAEHWPGDPSLLDASAGVSTALRDLTGPERRDAMRAMRGRVLRAEVYARDGTERAGLPYSVTEYAYGLRSEARGSFFAFETAQRTTVWERGDDPLTRVTTTGDHDAFGQPRRHTMVALPRRSARRTPLPQAPVGLRQPDPVAVQAIHTHTEYAAAPEGVGIHDRVAHVRRYELANPPEIVERDPARVQQVVADQLGVAKAVGAAFAAPGAGEVRLIGHSVNHYDGEAFTGLAPGVLGPYGLLSRSEVLIGTADTFSAAYGDWCPAVLGGTEPFPASAPAVSLGLRRENGTGGYTAGWYGDIAAHGYDVQLGAPGGRSPRGVPLRVRDPMRHETQLTPDDYWLMPQAIRDPLGLITTADYDYRHGKPTRVTDPNGTTTRYRYTTLGLLEAAYLDGLGTPERPDTRYEYDFGAFDRDGAPIWVHTTRRAWHALDPPAAGTGADPDAVLVAREFSDGLGRLVQRRALADALRVDTGLDVTQAPVAGRPDLAAPGPAAGTAVPDRVVVSGWQARDNKGRVIATYEPFFGRGWAYQPPDESRRGQRVVTRYDARGRMVEVVNPDGSRKRTVFGIPTDLTDPASAPPSPWLVTSYDENDLAIEAGHAAAVPADQRHTPETSVLDPQERVVCRLSRGGPAGDLITGHEYDVRGNVVTVLDAHGRAAFRHAYDLADRQVSVDSIDAGRSITVLDASGQPVFGRTAVGALTVGVYDAGRRPVAVYATDRDLGTLTRRERYTYGDTLPPGPERDAAMTVCALGRLWRQDDEAGRLQVASYDAQGRLNDVTRTVISDQALSAGWTASWDDPDADGALDPTGYRTVTRHDALGRVAEVTDHTGQHVVAGYGRSGALTSLRVDGATYLDTVIHNARGQRELVGLGNGLVTRYAYHPTTFQMIRMHTQPATRTGDTWTAIGSPVQNLGFSYDLAGDLTSSEERTLGCGVAGTPGGRDALIREFGYDPHRRLVSATGRACPTPSGGCGYVAAPFIPPPAAPNQGNAPDVTTAYRETYGYDPSGNLIDIRWQPTGGTPAQARRRQFGIDGGSLGDSSAATTNRCTAAGDAVLTYDDAGQLAEQGESRRYRWDHAGRLVGFEISAGATRSLSARYLYGADGRRVKKFVRRGMGAAFDESAVYVGDLSEQHAWARGRGGGGAILHLNDGDTRIASVRTGKVHPRDAGPAIRYELRDHSSSVTMIVDGTGGWLNREEYSPYGETTFGGFARKRYRFSGKERDEESGLAYHGARYYAPGLARWVSPDPLAARAGPNAYRYVSSSPVSRHDPTGLDDKPVPAQETAVVDPAAKKRMDWAAAAARTANLIREDLENWQARYQQEGVFPLYGSQSDFADLQPRAAEKKLNAWNKGHDPLTSSPEVTDCILYVRRYLVRLTDELASPGTKEAVRMSWEAHLKVDLQTLEKGKLGTPGRGMGVITALRQLGWTVIYYNVNGAMDAEYKKVAKLGYVSPEGKASVRGLDGKPVRVRSKVDKMWAGTGTSLTTKQLERLANAPFVVGAQDFGYHTYLVSYGSVFEAHWAAEPNSPNVVERSDPKTFITGSGVLAIPPGF